MRERFWNYGKNRQTKIEESNVNSAYRKFQDIFRKIECDIGILVLSNFSEIIPIIVQISKNAGRALNKLLLTAMRCDTAENQLAEVLILMIWVISTN